VIVAVTEAGVNTDERGRLSGAAGGTRSVRGLPFSAFGSGVSELAGEPPVDERLSMDR
jgi:hypothetical protein